MHALRPPKFQDQESKWIPVRTKERTKEMVLEASSAAGTLSNNMFNALNRETIMLEVEPDKNQSSMESLKTKTKQLSINLPGSEPLIIQNGEQKQHKLLPVSADKIADHISSFLTHPVSRTNSLKRAQ